MIQHPDIKQIAVLLQQQISQVSDFNEHLERIKQAISQNELTLLNELISQTQGFFQAMDNSKAMLMQNLGASSESDLPQLLQTYIVNNDPQQQLGKLIITLDEQMKDLQKALLINDLLVRKNQHRIKQSIRILTGHDGQANHSATYSRSGDTTRQGDSQHTLARA